MEIANTMIFARAVFRKIRQSHSKPKVLEGKQVTTTKGHANGGHALVETKCKFLSKVSKPPRRDESWQAPPPQQ